MALHGRDDRKLAGPLSGDGVDASRKSLPNPLKPRSCYTVICCDPGR